MKRYYLVTPKEGVGRSNRLGDANKNKGLQMFCSPFCLSKIDTATSAATSGVL